MAQLNMYNCLIYNELYCAAYYSDNCFDAIENAIGWKNFVGEEGTLFKN